MARRHTRDAASASAAAVPTRESGRSGHGPPAAPVLSGWNRRPQLFGAGLSHAGGTHAREPAASPGARAAPAHAGSHHDAASESKGGRTARTARGAMGGTRPASTVVRGTVAAARVGGDDPKALEYLSSVLAGPGASSEDKAMALREAAMANSAAAVRAVLPHATPAIAAHSLSLAAGSGHTEVLQAILDACVPDSPGYAAGGAPVLTPKVVGKALQSAARALRCEAVDTLLASGVCAQADVNASLLAAVHGSGHRGGASAGAGAGVGSAASQAYAHSTGRGYDASSYEAAASRGGADDGDGDAASGHKGQHGAPLAFGAVRPVAPTSSFQRAPGRSRGSRTAGGADSAQGGWDAVVAVLASLLPSVTPPAVERALEAAAAQAQVRLLALLCGSDTAGGVVVLPYGVDPASLGRALQVAAQRGSVAVVSVLAPLCGPAQVDLALEACVRARRVDAVEAVVGLASKEGVARAAAVVEFQRRPAASGGSDRGGSDRGGSGGGIGGGDSGGDGDGDVDTRLSSLLRGRV